MQLVVTHEIEDGLRHTRIHAQGQKPRLQLILTQNCVGHNLARRHLANGKDNEAEEVQQEEMLERIDREPPEVGE